MPLTSPQYRLDHHLLACQPPATEKPAFTSYAFASRCHCSLTSDYKNQVPNFGLEALGRPWTNKHPEDIYFFCSFSFLPIWQICYLTAKKMFFYTMCKMDKMWKIHMFLSFPTSMLWDSGMAVMFQG